MHIVSALGELGDAKATAALATALKDESADVRVHAASALGEIGDRTAVDALIAATKDKSPDVRRHAISALGEIGDTKAMLLRAPGFALVALAALTLGIGANTAIFSVVNTLLLERLPYKDPGRLAVVWERNIAQGSKNNVTSPNNFFHWREMNRVFEDLAMVSLTFRTTLTGEEGAPEELPVQYVTAALSSVLGVPPQQGRLFAPPDDDPSANVVIISDRLWKRRFGADPGIINRTIQLNSRPQLVVGVMPPGFSVLDKTVEIWQPVGFDREGRSATGRWLTAIGRLRPGVTLAQAQDDMEGPPES